MCEKDDIILEKLDAINRNIDTIYNRLSTLVLDVKPVHTVQADDPAGTCSHSFIEMSDGTFMCRYCPAEKENDGKNL